MQIYLVGGAVRDTLLGLNVTERDWVVIGATQDQMLTQDFVQVGKSFPVFLHPKTKEEYALGRIERKTGKGYTAFNFKSTPDVSLEEDLLRRDLTINAIAQDSDGQLIDPYHGKQDIDNRVLRHVSPAFAEDPVRILRIARFAARFAHLGFTIADETYTLMQQMVQAGEVDALVPERVFKEWQRALTEQTPEQFFKVLSHCGALARLFPEWKNHWQTPQPTQYLCAIAKKHPQALIRFAALFYQAPNTNADNNAKVATIICKRYNVPRTYSELAYCVETYLPYLDATPLTAERTLDLLMKSDALRKNTRFEQFLQIAQIIIQINGKIETVDAKIVDFAKIRIAREQIAQIDVAALVKQGLTGSAIKTAIYQLRLDKLKVLFEET